MKVNINNKNIIRRTVTSEDPYLCSSCFFKKYHINCFENIYDRLHGCALTLSYYAESNTDNSLFKL